MSKSPSLRRIQADIRELALNPSDQYFAAPLENDMFEWHFTIRGATGTDFEGGIYHGRILLPAEYPYKPPHIVFLTPSGRFETNTKVCLSFSAYHPELWQPAWGIRLILEALISFLPTPGDGAIGALDYKPEERRRLAKQSQTWCCPKCGPIAKLLPKVDPKRKELSQGLSFSKEIAELQRLQQVTEGVKQEPKEDTEHEPPSAMAPNETTTNSRDREIPLPNSESGASEVIPTPQTAIPEQNLKIPFTSSLETKTIEQTDEDSPSETRTENNIAKATESEDVSVASTTSKDAVLEEVPPLVEPNEGENVENSLSNLYDPLLNLSIFLMLCICALLWKKAMDLTRELQELESMPLVDGFTSHASAATASSSSEL